MAGPKVFIDGEHGTTGLQIRERLAPRTDIALLEMAFEDRRDRSVRERMLREADFAILCLPDEAARESVAMAQGSATRFIDASTAHRTDPDWTFGFAEMTAGQRDRIAKADRVANPGCYPTGAVALVRPLREADILPSDVRLTINAVSGYSGGGKALIADMESGAIDAPIYLYATGLAHKHVPEIMRHGLLDHAPIFAPHVGRFAQGMLVEIPLHLEPLGTTRERMHEVLSDHYAESDVVEVVPLGEVDRVVPTALNGTDRMRLHVFGNDGQVNLVAVLDNLGKGASGACVQDLDIMIAG